MKFIIGRRIPDTCTSKFQSHISEKIEYSLTQKTLTFHFSIKTVTIEIQSQLHWQNFAKLTI